MLGQRQRVVPPLSRKWWSSPNSDAVRYFQFGACYDYSLSCKQQAEFKFGTKIECYFPLLLEKSVRKWRAGVEVWWVPSVSGDSFFNLCHLIVFQTFSHSLISNIWILPNTWAVLLLIMWCHSWVEPVCKAFRASVGFRLWKQRLTVSTNLAENRASRDQVKIFFLLLSSKEVMHVLSCHQILSTRESLKTVIRHV